MIWTQFAALLLAFAATTAGAVSGMGGGVILKPLLDATGMFDVESIGVLTSATVLVMAVVSVAKHRRERTHLPVRLAAPLVAGSVAGGFLGQLGLHAAVAALHLDGTVFAIQNGLLAAMILAVYLYMHHRAKIRPLDRTGIPSGLLVGLLLGVVSSFLGIGGGPINVALLLFVFSFDLRTTTVLSLLIILAAQVSKIATVAATTGFARYDLSVLPVMAVAAVAGGFVGSHLSTTWHHDRVHKAFQTVQLVVLAIALYNIVRSLVP